MNTNNPLISVIIPAYNHEKYIQETIQGIINQTYLNIELIIIDDGSPDNTFQKINEMKDICKKRFVNVIFETQQNQGSCITLNRLLHKVNGDYIAMCASDDVYQPEFIKTCLSFLIKNPKYGACFVDSLFINENSQIIYWGENRITETSSKKAKFKTFGQFLKKARKDVNFNSSD